MLLSPKEDKLLNILAEVPTLSTFINDHLDNFRGVKEVEDLLIRTSQKITKLKKEISEVEKKLAKTKIYKRSGELQSSFIVEFRLTYLSTKTTNKAKNKTNLKIPTTA